MWQATIDGHLNSLEDDISELQAVLKLEQDGAIPEQVTKAVERIGDLEKSFEALKLNKVPHPYQI